MNEFLHALIGVFITAGLLKGVTYVLRVVEIDDWLTAVLVAALAAVVGIVTRLGPALMAQGVVGWSISVLVLALAITVMPGIGRKDAVSVLVTATVVRALGLVAGLSYGQLLTLGMR